MSYPPKTALVLCFLNLPLEWEGHGFENVPTNFDRDLQFCSKDQSLKCIWHNIQNDGRTRENH